MGPRQSMSKSKWPIQGVDKTDFYEAAFLLENTKQQQEKIHDLIGNFRPLHEVQEQTTLPSTHSSRKFLDAIAYIFSQSAASDVVASALEQSGDSPRRIYTVHVSKNNGDYNRLQALKDTFEQWSCTLNDLWFYGPDPPFVAPSIDIDLLQLDDELWVSILLNNAVGINNLVRASCKPCDPFTPPSTVLVLRGFLADNLDSEGKMESISSQLGDYTQPEIFVAATAMLSFVDALILYKISSATEILKRMRNKGLNAEAKIFQFRQHSRQYVETKKGLTEHEKSAILRELHIMITSSYRVLHQHGNLAEMLVKQ